MSDMRKVNDDYMCPLCGGVGLSFGAARITHRMVTALTPTVVTCVTCPMVSELSMQGNLLDIGQVNLDDLDPIAPPMLGIIMTTAQLHGRPDS